MTSQDLVEIAEAAAALATWDQGDHDCDFFRSTGVDACDYCRLLSALDRAGLLKRQGHSDDSGATPF